MDRERMSGGGIGSAGGEAGPWARRVGPVVVLMTATTLGCSGGGGSEDPTDPGPTGDATIEATVTADGEPVLSPGSTNALATGTTGGLEGRHMGSDDHRDVR